jgi:hypothetical protein
MPTTHHLDELAHRQAELRAALGAIGDMRPGSLVERYRACGKPGCHCARPGARGHGPSWSLTHQVAGKTITKIIPPAAVDSTRAQIAEYHRFRALMKELIDVSERLCDARVAQDKAASHEAAKKGASRKPSARKSSQR